VEIAHRNYPVAVVLEEAEEIPLGGTIRNTVGARPIVTVQPQTGLGAVLEGTLLLTARLVLDSSLAVKVAIWPATGAAPA
jgi:hypothetical protein